MEVLVQWFTDNLSQHISRELIIFIISMAEIQMKAMRISILY